MASNIKGQPAGSASLPETENIKLFRKAANPTAAILYQSGLLFLRQSRSPGLSQPDTARYGRLTLMAGPAPSARVNRQMLNLAVPRTSDDVSPVLCSEERV